MSVRSHTRLRGKSRDCSSGWAVWPGVGKIWVPGGEARDDKVTESPREKPGVEENASRRGKI